MVDSDDGGHLFLHFDANESHFFAILAALTLTVIGAFQAQVVTVTVFLLTATLLTVTASEELAILLTRTDIEGLRVPLNDLADALRTDVFSDLVIAAFEAATTRLTVSTRSKTLTVEFKTFSFLAVTTRGLRHHRW